MTYKVVILSSRSENLFPCVETLRRNEPNLPPQNILVVDDGARERAEASLPDITWLDGMKPFIFARNANIGLSAAESDVILLNDDARLLTRNGFTLLTEEMKKHPNVGVCSAGIEGIVGNPHQLAKQTITFRYETKMLAFICVFISLSTYLHIGPLDESFIGYGFDDNDYCRRVLNAGLQLGIWDGCVVDHSGQLPSTYRAQPNIHSQFQQNQRHFEEKWQSKSSDLLRSHQNNMPVLQPTVDDRRLNLGCCESNLEGYLNCDIFPPSSLATINFQNRWPWEDNSFAFVRAHDFVEHLPDKLFTMNELWRVLAPNGRAEISIPTTEGSGAFQDPTHVSFWNRRSFCYYEHGNPYRERFGKFYDIYADFRVIQEQIDQTADGPRLTILLEAIKT